MADIKKEQEREDLHRAIWAIADDLRGSVDGWDFKSYVLGTMFYRYISENLANYMNEKDIIGTYTDPNIRVAYSDGEIRQEFAIVYCGEALNYDVSLNDESSQFKWVPLNEVIGFPLEDS